jgi:hypothetical protein
VVKIRPDLIPPVFIRGIARALAVGGEKRGETGTTPNWAEGESFQVHVGAIYRHMTAWQTGETHDEDGNHHLACVGARVAILMDLDMRFSGTKFDDRPPPLPQACPVYPPKPSA